MSKGAVIAMTFSVAKGLPPTQPFAGNCISPARVHTPFVDDYLRKNLSGREKESTTNSPSLQPVGRIGQPDEV